MSLTFAGSNTDQVAITQTTNINSQDAGTLMFWVNFNGFGVANRRLLWKNGGLNLQTFSGTNQAQLFFNHTRSVTSSTVQNNSGDLSTGTWYFVVIAYDLLTAPQLFLGTLTSLIDDSKSAVLGSGTSGNDSASNAILGNRESTSLSINGSIALFHWVNVRLTQGQVESQWIWPHPTANSQVFYQCGFSGTTTQTDWSGQKNNGAITGSTIAAHVPLGRFWGDALMGEDAYTVIPPVNAKFDPRVSVGTLFGGRLGLVSVNAGGF